MPDDLAWADIDADPVAFDAGGDGEEGLGEHREGGPAVPRGPAPDLVLIKSGEALGGLEALFDAPALSGDADQRRHRRRSRTPAAVVGELAGLVVTADQQMMLTGRAVVRRLTCVGGGFGASASQAQE